MMNYNFENFQKQWVEKMLDVYMRRYGSWETEKLQILGINRIIK
jgi:hypothetical protein